MSGGFAQFAIARQTRSGRSVMDDLGCFACKGTRGERHATSDCAYQLCECADCGSLRLLDPPLPEIAYGPDYYAHKPLKNANFPAFLLGMDLSVFLHDYIRYVGCSDPEKQTQTIEAAVEKAIAFYLPNLSKEDRILDVGSGDGALVMWLRKLGYCDAIGIDPLSTEASVSKVGRLTLDDFETGHFDVIIFNHSLEHSPDPAKTLSNATRILHRNGRILARLPVTGGYAWQTLGMAWPQIDAPRHHFIPTEDGMRQLAQRAGLTVTDRVFDSGFLQFGSDEKTPLRPEMMPAQTRLATMLNGIGQGDQAAFYLRKGVNA